MDRIKITYDDFCRLRKYGITIHKRNIIGHRPEQDEYNRIMQLCEDDKLDAPACPKCGNKLQINTEISLLSNPLQYHAWCKTCGYKGYVFTHDSKGE